MEKVSISLLEVGDKARSKAELFSLLTTEGHLYLPPYKYCSIEFIADIVEGKRKVSCLSAAEFNLLMKALESKEVIICHLPHIKGLRTEDLVNFLVDDSQWENYLPSNYNETVLYRDWVGNLCKYCSH